MYTVGNTAIDVAFTAWTYPTSECGPITYTMTKNPTGSLNSFIIFTAGTRNIHIYSTSISDAGVYTYLVKGALAKGGVSKTFTF